MRSLVCSAVIGIFVSLSASAADIGPDINPDPVLKEKHAVCAADGARAREFQCPAGAETPGFQGGCRRKWVVTGWATGFEACAQVEADWQAFLNSVAPNNPAPPTIDPSVLRQ